MVSGDLFKDKKEKKQQKKDAVYNDGEGDLNPPFESSSKEPIRPHPLVNKNALYQSE